MTLEFVYTMFHTERKRDFLTQYSGLVFQCEHLKHFQPLCCVQKLASASVFGVKLSHVPCNLPKIDTMKNPKDS